MDAFDGIVLPFVTDDVLVSVSFFDEEEARSDYALACFFTAAGAHGQLKAKG